MMEKTDFLKMAKTVFKRGQGVPDKRLMHPKRDWGIGILIFVFVSVAGSYLSASSFSQYRNIEVSGGQSANKLPRYNEKQIESAIEDYAAKTASFSALVGDKVEVEEVIEIASSTASSSDQVTDPENVSTSTASEIEL